MAAKHSKGNARPSNIPNERRLTVGKQVYDYPERQDGTPRRGQGIPWLQMRGHWLAAAGFDIRQPVRVRVMRGCLVLTTEDATTEDA